MARPPRIAVPGGVYHVTARGNRGGLLYASPGDEEAFLDLVADIVRRLEWRCHSYCLMSNHYHLLLATPRGDISAGMHGSISRIRTRLRSARRAA